MKVSELIKKLQAMPQDLEVYAYCDHGQSPEKVSSPGLAYASELEHTLWDEWVGDSVDAAAQDYDKQFVLL